MAIDSSEKLEASKWAVYEKSVQTYAVKPTVYPAVAERTVNSLTISWDAEAAASEVDSIKWKVLGSDEVNSRLLTAEEVQAAKATVTGLEAFTNYVVSVYFKSANRGDLSLWTRSNTDASTTQFPQQSPLCLPTMVTVCKFSLCMLFALLECHSFPYPLHESCSPFQVLLIKHAIVLFICAIQ